MVNASLSLFHCSVLPTCFKLLTEVLSLGVSSSGCCLERISTFLRCRQASPSLVLPCLHLYVQIGNVDEEVKMARDRSCIENGRQLHSRSPRAMEPKAYSGRRPPYPQKNLTVLKKVRDTRKIDATNN